MFKAETIWLELRAAAVANGIRKNHQLMTEVAIRLAQTQDTPAVACLFNTYRQFYEQVGDITLAVRRGVIHLQHQLTGLIFFTPSKHL